MNNFTPKILIIDDEEKIGENLALFFEMEGYITKSIVSPIQGLEEIKTNQYDCILIDYLMPEMSGLEFLIEYRKDHSKLDFPLVIMTGIDTSDTMLKALTNGANDYVSKTDLEIALARVNTVLELKLSKKELEHANSEIKNLSHIKDRFLANMSHEIRTPMNAIVGLTDLLLETSLTEEQLQYVQTFQRSSESLLSIINDILDISKIDSGKYEIQKEEFNFLEQLSDIEFLFQKEARDMDLEFRIKTMPDIPRFIIADKNRLKQIIVNLISNAFKFTTHGLIMVKTSISWSKEKHRLLNITVLDTGIGIPKEKIESIFKPFTQADDSTTKEHSGAGLGLTICKDLVEQMGGSITVTSDYGNGAEFILTMPIELDIIPGVEKTITKNIASGRVFNISQNDNKKERDIKNFSKRHQVIYHANVEGEAIEALKLLRKKSRTPDIILIEESYNKSHAYDTMLRINDELSWNDCPIAIYTRKEGGIKITRLAMGKIFRNSIASISKDFLSLGNAEKFKLLIINNSNEPFTSISTDLLQMEFNSTEVQINTVSDTSQADKLVNELNSHLILTSNWYSKNNPKLNSLSKADSSLFIIYPNFDTQEDDPKEIEREIQSYKELYCSLISTPSTSIRMRRILIVDDVKTNIILLRSFLKNENYELTACENGKEAVALFQKESFDLILMDIQMPIMSGLEATRMIRTIEKGHEVQNPIPIIAISANAFEEDRIKSINAGCLEHFNKPVKKSHLLNYIKILFDPMADEEKCSA